MTRAKDKELISKLGHQQRVNVFWFEDGGAEVFKLWDTLVLFEIPQYGGEGRFTATYHESEVDSLLDRVYSWT